MNQQAEGFTLIIPSLGALPLIVRGGDATLRYCWPPRSSIASAVYCCNTKPGLIAGSVTPSWVCAGGDEADRERRRQALLARAEALQSQKADLESELAELAAEAAAVISDGEREQLRKVLGDIGGGAEVTHRYLAQCAVDADCAGLYGHQRQKLRRTPPAILLAAPQS